MAILSEIDPRVYTKMPYPECPNLRVRYLGTAGFVFEATDHTIVVDPHVSRPSTWDTATKPLQPMAASKVIFLGQTRYSWGILITTTFLMRQNFVSRLERLCSDPHLPQM